MTTNRHGLDVTKYQEQLRALADKLMLMTPQQLHNELIKITFWIEVELNEQLLTEEERKAISEQYRRKD